MMNHITYTKNILQWLLLLITFHAFTEGSRELQPQDGDFGYLQITKHENFTDFGHYGADPSRQINIRVNEVGETVYYGLNNMTEGGNVFVEDVPYRIVSPSGVVVEQGVIPDIGEQGNIPNWDEAAAGPASLVGAGGYDNLSFIANETGDYVLEFDIEAIDEREVHIQYFDVTIANTDGDEVPGRLYSEGWQLSTGGHDNGFDGAVYPYDDQDGTVYEVSFDDISPFTFNLNFNSFGIEDTGDFFEDRRSRDGIHLNPEHKIFLNPPDSTVFPTDPHTDFDFLGAAELMQCSSNDYCLHFTSSEDGFVEGFIDVSQTNSFDPSIDVPFSEEITADDTICIPWDGRDANGNLVSADKISVITSMGQNPMHIPLYDIENNVNGIRVSIVRPQGIPDPRLFWEDTDVSGGNALDGLVNLEGCESNGQGCHRWEERGDDDDSPVDGSETINTWWYSSLQTDTVFVQTFVNRDIQLSFDQASLSGKDTTVCEGDTIHFYVYEEESDHFDTDFFTYKWYQNGNELSGEENTADYVTEADGSNEIVIEAISNEDNECVYYDTLTLDTQPPVQINATINDETCEERGSIIIDQVTQGPPDISYNWTDYPDSSGTSLTNLEGGAYQVIIADTSFSENCALDTTFTLEEATPISFDTLILNDSRCFEATGEAEVRMEDPSGDYEFTLNGESYGTQTVYENLYIGEYTLEVVTTQGAVCTADTIFDIEGIRDSLIFDTTHVTCAGNDGRIEIEPVPDPDLVTLTWADGSNAGYARTDLSPGEYNFSVKVPGTPFCDVDTSTTLELRDDIAIDEVDTTSSSCFVNDGSATVSMVEGGYDYQYSFDGDGFNSENYRDELAPGTYDVVVETGGGVCSDTAPFTIVAGRLNIETATTPERCSAENGAIEVTQAMSAITIQWHDNDPAGFTRENAANGSYRFTIENPDIPGCEADTTVEVGHETYELTPSFTIEETINDGTYDVDENLTFTNTSTMEYYSVHWSFDDGNTSNATQPVHAYSSTGEYFSNLYIEDKYGCYGNEEKLVVIEDVPPCEAVIPNAFSPNDDNINDDIGVIGHVMNMDLKIYNRWGEVIFRSNESEERWDGYYRGQKAPVGVYPYTLKYTCLREGDKEETFTEVGEITLVR